MPTQDNCCIIAYTVYLLLAQITFSNSRTSNLWRLNADETKIVEANSFQSLAFTKTTQEKQFWIQDDPVFNIIASTVHYGPTWMKQDVECYCVNCAQMQMNLIKSNSSSLDGGIDETDYDDALDCGKPVNFTYYDNLVGVLNRNRHPIVPEPQVSLIFGFKTKRQGQLATSDVDAFEKRLKRAKREKPKSVQLYNQIGNFWRVKGDVRKAIECFRRALAVSPHNSEVLLNLARVLFTLQYLDDAIYLTRRSLEMQPPNKGAWQQYFTLGEIFKAYGHYHEATLHLKHTLELKPDFEPALIALKEMESAPTVYLHVYTLLIIVILVSAVLLVILSVVNTQEEGEPSDGKAQRQFNRASAMCTLRNLRITQKNVKAKKCSATSQL